MSNPLKHLAVLFLALIGNIAPTGAQTVSSELDRSTLVLKLTVSNPGNVVRRIVEVGIKRDVDGEFKCLATGVEPKLKSLADYPIEFYLMGVPQYTVPADPILVIAPGEAVSYTIALSPNPGWACGSWSFQVSGLAVLDDGTQLESVKTVITSDDFKAAINRPPTREEVFGLLKHREPELRIKGIEGLNEKDFDTPTLKKALMVRLDDPIPRVRLATYKKIAALKLLGLESALMVRLQRLHRLTTQDEPFIDSSDAIGLVDALSEMKSMAVADKILDLLEDRNFSFAILLKGPLQKLQSPEVLAKIIARLKKNKHWASVQEKYGHEEYEGSRRYYVLLSALISYRDPSTLLLLKSIMDDPENAPAVRSIMHLFIDLADRAQQAEDPFMRGFLQYAEKFLHDDGKDEKVNLRGPATILFVRTTADRGKKIAILKNALKDTSVYVRLDAAREVGALKLKQLVPELQSAHKSASDKLKDHFCEPLTQLGETCQRLTLPPDALQVRWQEEVMLSSKKCSLLNAP